MARYLIVVIGGFVVDISIALLMHEIFGIDLVVAAALAFVVAMTLSYFVHEFWTFRRAYSAYSTARLSKFAIASCATLTTRLLIVSLSASMAVLPFGTILRLLFAFGGSLAVGYLINRFVVFGSRSDE